MTSSKVRRATIGTLPAQFGPDRGKRIVVSFEPSNGHGIPDCLTFRPMRSRRLERMTVQDCYAYALRCRVNLLTLAKAQERKSKKAERLARARQDRTEKRLFA